MNEGFLSPELVREVKVAVRRRIARDREQAPPDVAAILRVVEERLDDPELYPIDLRGLAGDAVTRLRFRLHLGLDVDDYLDQRRVEIVYELIVGSDARLAEIGAVLGFTDADIFAKWFQRRTGISPATLRERFASEKSSLVPVAGRPLPQWTESEDSGEELSFHDWQRAVVEVLESGRLEKLIRLGVESYPEVARLIPSLESAVRLHAEGRRSRSRRRGSEED